MVAESLINIAENMEGQRDDVSPTLKRKLDEFEVYVFVSWDLSFGIYFVAFE